MLEMFCEGKAGKEACEDRYVVTDDFIAVIDGVTSKSDFSYEGKTTGRLAAELTAKAIRSLPPASTLEQAVEAINREMQGFYEAVPFPYERREKGLQAVCVIYSSHCRKIWMIGDCQAVVDGKMYTNPKKSDQILSEARALMIACMKRSSPAVDEEEILQTAREAILPWILKATEFSNDAASVYGYPMLNGEPIPKSLIREISLEREGCEVILTSDGYPVVEPTLERTEQKLKELLAEDPGCCRVYLSTKGLQAGYSSFDDRTYIRFLTE